MGCFIGNLRASILDMHSEPRQMRDPNIMKTNHALLISLGIVLGISLAKFIDNRILMPLIAGLIILFLIVTSILIKLKQDLVSKKPANPAARTQAEGTVKWFNYKKGFGFIEQENGEDVFVHHNSIISGKKKPLREGQKVSMDVVQSDKGPQAENVNLL